MNYLATASDPGHVPYGGQRVIRLKSVPEHEFQPDASPDSFLQLTGRTDSDQLPAINDAYAFDDAFGLKNVMGDENYRTATALSLPDEIPYYSPHVRIQVIRWLVEN